MALILSSILDKNKYLILSQKHRAHLIPQFPIPVSFHSSVGNYIIKIT